MAVIASAAVKRCATCEYWGGARAAGFSGREVQYKIKSTDSDSGMCTNKNAMKKGRPVRGDDPGCHNWVKWSNLK